MGTIDTQEQSGAFVEDSNSIAQAISTLEEVFGVRREEICDIHALKKGMTNRSFVFTVRGKKYIIRIPGEGTDRLINRAEEANVYQTIAGKGICDNVVYINPINGYKVTEYIQSARVCDSLCPEDVQKCMKRLRSFHELRLQVDHAFDLFGQIAFYESLWAGTASAYEDYAETKEHVLSLRGYIDACPKEWCLTHIDAVPDNFLFSTDEHGSEAIRLIDWEYAGMQDPHVDIAMFCIYALYDKRKIDTLIETYFPEGCDERTKTKITCYIAVCGLLWSNWCEYKHKLGVEFGEYSLRQYQYAKDYYRIAAEEIRKQG